MKKQWLPLNYIEQEANKLIFEYNGFRANSISEPPVPIDSIIESYLGLQIDIDSPKVYNLSENTLGALYVEEKRIFINQDIVNLEGRSNYTLAHEVGHWRLHKDDIPEIQYSLPLVQENSTSTEQVFKRGHVVICRNGDKNPIEWQADQFAAFLLMPSDLLIPACNDVIEQVKADNKITWSSLSTDEENIIIKTLAEKFRTSKIAMRIRLEGMSFFGKDKNQLALF